MTDLISKLTNTKIWFGENKDLAEKVLKLIGKYSEKSLNRSTALMFVDKKTYRDPFGITIIRNGRSQCVIHAKISKERFDKYLCTEIHIEDIQNKLI